MKQQLWVALPLIGFLVGSFLWYQSPAARHSAANTKLASAITRHNEADSLAALAAGADPNMHVHQTPPSSLWNRVVHPSTADKQDQEWQAYWQPALAPALDWGDDKIIQALLSRGADINERDSGGHSLLSTAVFTRRQDLVSLLLNQGADNGCKAKALLTGVGQGDIATVQELIARGADINGCDDDGSTPLMEATLGHHQAILQLLIDHGADVNRRDKHGWSALSWALYGSGGLTMKTPTAAELRGI